MRLIYPVHISRVPVEKLRSDHIIEECTITCMDKNRGNSS